jgi:phytoene synthase
MPDDPQKIFERKSRSFSLAARLFSPGTRSDIARLYCFCRYVDDLADASARGEPERLDEIAETLGNDATETNDPIVQDFLDLAKNRGLPMAAAYELVEALRADCGPRNILTEDSLKCFAYGVAGTVGLLMRPILGADDARAAPFAIDLGIALQLTNIARDVSEDAARGRYYLPAEWVAPAEIRSAVDDANPDAIAAVDKAVGSLLELAGKFYQSARNGHGFIPPRNRLAVYFALHIYEAIGLKIQRKGSGAWRTRIHLGLLEKLGVAFAAIPGYFRYKRLVWDQPHPPVHSAALHSPLTLGRR